MDTQHNPKEPIKPTAAGQQGSQQGGGQEGGGREQRGGQQGGGGQEGGVANNAAVSRADDKPRALVNGAAGDELPSPFCAPIAPKVGERTA